MAQTAHHSNTAALPVALTLIAAVTVLSGHQVLAQSGAAFATIPYTPNIAQQPLTLPPAVVPAVPLAPTIVSSVRYKGPPPVVMFRGTPPPRPALGNVVSESRPELIATPVHQITQPNRGQTPDRAGPIGWDRASLDPVIAPPVVSDGQVIVENLADDLSSQTRLRRHRSPLRRILEDTGKGLTRDLPEAVANALPWVDRDFKNAPFDEVLTNVADDLHRASLADPAWALPVQREIRALSRRLDRLPAPPPLVQDERGSSRETEIADLGNRPFRPRPIWPGASGRPEPQVRPVTLTTLTDQQDGPQANGVAARYEPAAEDDDGREQPIALPRAQPDRRNPNPARRSVRPR